jgi:hypothetical protein
MLIKQLLSNQSREVSIRPHLHFTARIMLQASGNERPDCVLHTMSHPRLYNTHRSEPIAVAYWLIVFRLIIHVS